MSWGGWGSDSGSIIVSAKGDILAEAMKGEKIAIADIDPKQGRDNADWSNAQTDVRSRLFRERRPEAFANLTDPTPPVFTSLPEMESGPPEMIAEVYRKGTTIGHVEYETADKLAREGKTEEARAAFQKLIEDYPCSWFDRTARERLIQMHS